MAYPNILTFKGDGLVQYVSNTQFTALAEVVLEHMVSANGVGLLTTNSSFTSIGSFTDNFTFAEPGSTDLTLTSENKSYFQNLDAGAVGSTTAVPIEWNVGQGQIKTLDSDQLNALGDEIIEHMIANDGPGTYVLANTAPIDGGTWNQAFSILDKLSTSVNDTPISYVWEKTQGTTTLTDNILKLADSSFKFMTTSEIQSLVAVVRQRIIDTSIGTYALAETAPATGTWESKGTITDTSFTVGEGNFVGSVNYGGPGPGYVGDTFPSGFVYTGPTGNFIGPNRQTTTYQGVIIYVGSSTFTGTVITGTTTESETLTLWRRIA